MCIICKGEYNGETHLYCGDCTSLTSLPDIPNVTNLYCNGCTLLTALPEMPNMRYLYCHICTSITSLPDMSNITHFYCDGCMWLDHSNSNYTINISRLTRLQRWYRRMIWCRYLESRAFIEWCYHPDNIGGKQAKKNITVFTETM
jgi:hypothetical protein